MILLILFQFPKEYLVPWDQWILIHIPTFWLGFHLVFLLWLKEEDDENIESSINIDKKDYAHHNDAKPQA